MRSSNANLNHHHTLIINATKVPLGISAIVDITHCNTENPTPITYNPKPLACNSEKTEKRAVSRRVWAISASVSCIWASVFRLQVWGL